MRAARRRWNDCVLRSPGSARPPARGGTVYRAQRFRRHDALDAGSRGDGGPQPASFTRLAQALGHTGWDDFREALIEARRPAPPRRTPAACAARRKVPAGRRRPRGGDDRGRCRWPDRLAPRSMPPPRRRCMPRGASMSPGSGPAARWQCCCITSSGCSAPTPRWSRARRRSRARRHARGRGLRADRLRALFARQPGRQAAAREAGLDTVVLADSAAAPIAAGRRPPAAIRNRDARLLPQPRRGHAPAQALAAAVFTSGGAAARARLRETEARLAALPPTCRIGGTMSHRVLHRSLRATRRSRSRGEGIYLHRRATATRVIDGSRRRGGRLPRPWPSARDRGDARRRSTSSPTPIPRLFSCEPRRAAGRRSGRPRARAG